ncbi:unannotated protein [freshwater metagenome]|uniref:Unannotated protein n=1 Tax=freshwater metagenome TaxID=449393 RepID=A0A6J7FFN7_9ZZZZ|nr:hypothetical protein [Actinomycetota bacterium]
MSRRGIAHDLAVARCEARQFRDGEPYLWVLEFADDVLYACPALGVGEALTGDPQVVERLFLSALRTAAGRVDPATAPDDAVATALAVERATDDELRSWVRPRDPALAFASTRREAERHARERAPGGRRFDPDEDGGGEPATSDDVTVDGR